MSREMLEVVADACGECDAFVTQSIGEFVKW
jgi:hypothetical protein